MLDRLGSLMTVIAVLAVWQLCVTAFQLPAYIVPSPRAVLLAMNADLKDPSFWWHVAVTFAEVLFGFAIAAAIGVALGIGIGLSSSFERAIYPLVLAIQAVPKVAIAPLFIIWFGYGIQSKIVTAAVIAFFPILVNVVTGIKYEEPRRLMLLASMKATKWQTLFKVRLPGMLPYLFAGLEVALVFAVIGAIVGEFVGSSVGLGSVILQRQSSIDVAGVFSVLVVLSVITVALTECLKLVGRKYAAWAMPANRTS